MKEDDFFEKFSLEVQESDGLKIGEKYPFYGIITEFISDVPGSVIVTLNFSIKCHMNITEQDSIELLKERAFEPGIFVSEVLSLDDPITIDCQTIVYGKKQGKHS